MSDPSRLSVGDHAPAFSLPDQAGRTVSLADFAPRPVVLYFYPAALTPACTTQACDFRDNLGRLASAGYAVVGISKDDVPTLTRFAAEERLEFPLLSDPELAVHRAYGAWGEKKLYGKTVTGVLRSTFVVAGDGTLTAALYNVKATGHVDRILRLVGA
jgi:peroxiredoxin Q/BCP